MARIISVNASFECIDGRSYCSQYDDDICVGELIRNCCVNLSLNPITIRGVTENYVVFKKKKKKILEDEEDATEGEVFEKWNYNPRDRIGQFANEKKELFLVIEERQCHHPSLPTH